jgi:hypothetical protein
MIAKDFFKKILALLLVSAMLLGCSAVQAVQNMFATPTPTATQTLTPSPTITPSPTSTPLPDLSGAVLTLSDFPAGFEIYPPEDLGLTADKLGSADMPVGGTFGFANTQDIEFVFGFDFLLTSPKGKTAFGLLVNNPDLMSQSFTSSFDPNSILSQKTLSGLDNIGETASGVTVVINSQGVHLRMDLICFQRDIAGAIMVVMYVDGSTPPISTKNLAEIWDAKIQSSLGR